MKTIIITLACFATMLSSLVAGGGGEDIVAEVEGWTVRISSGGGSEGYIEKQVGDTHYHGRIGFNYFWDYYTVLKSFPRSKNNKKTTVWIIDENDPNEKNPAYLDPERALPIFHLMLLNHRRKISSDHPERLEKELNTHPPLPKEFIPNGNFAFRAFPHKIIKDEHGNATYAYPE
jgi:hypothetical protein